MNVAPIGWARPPLVFMTSIGLGVALSIVVPWRFEIGGAGTVLDTAAIVAACVLFLLAVHELGRVATPLSATRPATAIACRGPYRWTRNPIYLSFVVLQGGLSLLGSRTRLDRRFLGLVHPLAHPLNHARRGFSILGVGRCHE